MNTPEKTHSFWPLILPFAAFMLIALLEPKFGDESAGTQTPSIESSDDESQSVNGSSSAASEAADESNHSPVVLSDNAHRFLLIYSLKILVMTVLIVVFFKYYLSHFKFRLTKWGILFGLAGGVIWIGLSYLQIEKSIGGMLGMPETWFEIRSGINPAQHYPAPGYLWAFYAVRFFGLVVAVPIAEEIFLRGWLIRYIDDPEWWKVKIQHLEGWPLAVATIYGVLTHPTEAIAAIAWFSFITLLMVKTRSVWDCVMAHAITNLMLGIYVVNYAQWHLW